MAIDRNKLDPPPPKVGPSRTERRLEEEWERGAPKMKTSVDLASIFDFVKWVAEFVVEVTRKKKKG